MTLPDAYDYIALGLDAPEPDDPGTCPDCGREYCPAWCAPRWPSRRVKARSMERVENRGDA